MDEIFVDVHGLSLLQETPFRGSLAHKLPVYILCIIYDRFSLDGLHSSSAVLQGLRRPISMRFYYRKLNAFPA